MRPLEALADAATQSTIVLKVMDIADLRRDRHTLCVLCALHSEELEGARCVGTHARIDEVAGDHGARATFAGLAVDRDDVLRVGL